MYFDIKYGNNYGRRRWYYSRANIRKHSPSQRAFGSCKATAVGDEEKVKTG
jgi:hypothetical protein